MQKLLLILFLFLSISATAQDITNTLGENGTFTVKNDTETLLDLNQPDGDLSVLGKLVGSNLPAAVDSVVKNFTYKYPKTSSINRQGSYTGYYVTIGPLLLQWGTISIPSSAAHIFYIPLPVSYTDRTYFLNYDYTKFHYLSGQTDHQWEKLYANTKNASDFVIEVLNNDGGYGYTGYGFVDEEEFNFFTIGIAP